MTETEPMIEPLTFAPGDVVELKSGSPAMTVVAVKEDGVHCLWYADMADEVKTAVVPAICLEIAGFEEEGLDDEEEEDEDEDDEEGYKARKHGKKKRRDDD